MNQICKIILVRHGESVNNKNDIVGGDSPLTDNGREQAAATKKTLAGFNFDAVYSSDLDRAIETAEIISGNRISPKNKIPGLRERFFGSLDGKPGIYHDEEHAKRVTLSHQENRTYKHVPDIESYDELTSRFLGSLKKIADQNMGKTILVVAHGAAIRTSLMKLKDLSYHDLPQGSFKNAGYIEVDYDGTDLSVVHVEGAKILK
jgi:broad specificity phosphatase PhoE